MAPGIGDILYYMVHLEEFRAIIQWKVWHEPVHQRNESKESETLQTCFSLLNQTSRSFSAVIQELHPELLVPVALFYLIERGLDTIEDDMTLSLDKKEPLLRTFDAIIKKPGWNFKESGPNEKDRQLLVQFENVNEEFAKLKPEYQEIIEDITRKMGNGMADFASNATFNASGIEDVKDYDLYCHYVAGVVGEGLTRLFVESKLANPALLARPQLHESMGLFLQKINVIRDIREDFDDNRRFWPKEIWSKYVDKFEDLLKPENKIIAMNCSSEMTMNAMAHVPDCLYYLAGLKEQSVFNFCAIPQVMAISTLALVFRNPNLFQRNVKISKGEACRNMVDSTQNLRLVCEVFRKYTRKIHKKNTPRDPNFLKISISCGKVEQFIESIFPSQSPNSIDQQQASAPAVPPPDAKTPEEKKKAEEEKWDTIYMMIAVVGSMFILSTIMIGVAWFAGARFDLALEQLKQGRLVRPDPFEASKLVKQHDHEEL